MTNKEALQALLDGKKIRKKGWDANFYIYFDSEENLIKYQDGDYNLLLNISNAEYEEYKEQLLTDKEREYLKSLVSAYYEELREKLVVKRSEIFGDNELIIGYVARNENYVNKIASIQIAPTSYTFSGLENLKCYTLKELGIDD